MQSSLGAMLSIILAMLLLFYGAYKFNFMVERQGVTINSTVMEKYFSGADKFSAAQGLMLVAGT